MCEKKKIIFRILLNVVAKSESIQKVLLMIQWVPVGKLQKKQKLFEQILMKKRNL